MFSLNLAVVAAQEYPAGGRAASDSQGHWRPDSRTEDGKKLLLANFLNLPSVCEFWFFLVWGLGFLGDTEPLH